MAHKILLVDDEPFIAEEASEALTDEGYDCIAVDSVDAAMKTLKNNPDIAVIVTDMKMPGKSGADLIREVREGLAPDMKFIVMSGHGGITVGMNGVDIKAYPFLRKPLDIFELIGSVKTVLARTESPREFRRLVGVSQAAPDDSSSC